MDIDMDDVAQLDLQYAAFGNQATCSMRLEKLPSTWNTMCQNHTSMVEAHCVSHTCGNAPVTHRI